MNNKPRFEDTDEGRALIDVHRSATVALLEDFAQRMRDTAGMYAFHDLETDLEQALKQASYKFYVEDFWRASNRWEKKQRNEPA
jgi:hypothetical protein